MVSNEVINARDAFTKYRQPTFNWKDKRLYQAHFLFEHFFGKSLTDSMLGQHRKMLNERMRQAVEVHGEGRTLPLPEVHSISLEDFLQHFSKPGVPVVFRGAAAEWPCMKKWTLDYIEEHCGEDPVLFTDLVFKGKGRPTWDVDVMDMRSYIDHVKHGGKRHAKLQSTLTYHPEMLEDLDVDWLKRHRGSKLAEATISFVFFISPGGVFTGTHCGGNDDLFVQISGRKKWRFYPQSMTPALDPVVNRKFFKGTYLNPDRPDFDKYPIARHMDTFEVILEPGDVLFTPPYFWHNVMTLETGLAIETRWIHHGIQTSPFFFLLNLFNTNPNMFHIMFNPSEDFNVLMARANGKIGELEAKMKALGLRTDVLER